MGDALSMSRLATFYERGEFKDTKKYLYWLNKSAEVANCAFSMRRLGDVYFKGEIVEKDLDKAFYWYNKSLGQCLIDFENSKGKSCVLVGSKYSLAPLRELAKCYEFGYGTKKDLEKATYFYLLNANEDNRSGNYFRLIDNFINAGCCYLKMKPQYINLAFDCFEKSIQFEIENFEDLRKSYHYLALFYANGIYVKKDIQKAIELYKKSARGQSKFMLAYIYARGLGVEKDLDKAIFYMKKCDYLEKKYFILEDEYLIDNNPLMNTKEIVGYLNGLSNGTAKEKELLATFLSIRGEFRDFPKYVAYLEENIDNVQAKYTLAKIHLGLILGVTKEDIKTIKIDKNKGLKYLQELAQKGDADALGDLAFEYLKTENNKLAMETLFKAVDAGNIRASFFLAQMYFYGENVEQNYPKSIELFEKVWGNIANDKWISCIGAMSCYYLGECYEDGLSVQKNLRKAFDYYKMGNDAGDYKSTERLAYFYENGICVKKDMDKAKFYKNYFSSNKPKSDEKILDMQYGSKWQNKKAYEK